VKALDTGVLVALLEGDRSARDALRRLRGHEIATTEINLLELGALPGASRGRSGRRGAIARLRRKMTVLPVDARAIDEVARRRGGKDLGRTPIHVLAMLGALEASGCEELISDGGPFPGKWKFRVTRFSSTKRQ
jgi:predicted nucleic acid-binding protein